jgi:hypothetical protein
MSLNINRVCFLCLTVLLSAVQSEARQPLTQSRLAGTYVVGHEFGGSSLTLESDGRFSGEGGSDDGTVSSESGTYVLSEGFLRFTLTKSVGKRGDGKKERNLLDPEERKELFSGGTAAIVREFKMLPVTWSDRIYLIYENDLKDFANAINLGLEPRMSLTSQPFGEPYYGSFYLRRGDEQKKVTGHPSLPKEWLAFLLRKPVTATVISVQESKKATYVATSVVTVNKGSGDGLRVGMRLVVKGEEPSTSLGAEVISVGERTAKVKSVQVYDLLKVGDRLSTRYEPKWSYR